MNKTYKNAQPTKGKIKTNYSNNSLVNVGKESKYGECKKKGGLVSYGYKRIILMKRLLKYFEILNIQKVAK